MYEVGRKSTGKEEVMTNTTEFKIALLRNKLTAAELADKIGISRVSMSYKMNNIRSFTVTEISEIAKVLNLSLVEKERIFFGN